MRKLPSIVFRESCSLSKSGEREGWFWRVEKMESDLESLLEHVFFLVCFLNFVIKSYIESLLEMLLGYQGKPHLD